MKIDLHCHSLYSHDNHLDPRVVISRAIELGLDGVCFTEHHSVDVSWPVEKLERPADFVILRGAEVSTEIGHILVYGVKDDRWNKWGKNNYLKYDKMADAVHLMGGICVPAHPFRGWESVGDKIFVLGNIDAIETHNGVNGPEQNRLAEEAARKLAQPSVGGSDCHYPQQVGCAYTLFEHRITSTQDLIREIIAGRCKGETYPLAR